MSGGRCEREGVMDRERIHTVAVEKGPDWLQYWVMIDERLCNVHAYPPGPPSEYPYPYNGRDGWHFEVRWTVDEWTNPYASPREPERVAEILAAGKPGAYTVRCGARRVN